MPRTVPGSCARSGKRTRTLGMHRSSSSSRTASPAAGGRAGFACSSKPWPAHRGVPQQSGQRHPVEIGATFSQVRAERCFVARRRRSGSGTRPAHRSTTRTSGDFLLRSNSDRRLHIDCQSAGRRGSALVMGVAVCGQLRAGRADPGSLRRSGHWRRASGHDDLRDDGIVGKRPRDRHPASAAPCAGQDLIRKEGGACSSRTTRPKTAPPLHRLSIGG